MSGNAATALYKMDRDALSPISATSFENAGVLERSGIQRLLRGNVGVIAPDVLVIAEEFNNWQGSGRRIDLLGIDRSGSLVVIELKRDDDGAHMELQALRYAAMVARMTFDQAVAVFQRFLTATGGDPGGAEPTILKHLEWDEPQTSNFARDVRIVLAAADFSREITTTALWLAEREIDIRCVRLRPYELAGQLLLQVEQVIPLPDAEDYQVGIRDRAREERRAAASVDRTLYLLNTLGGQEGPLTKRRVVLEAVRRILATGVTPEAVQEAVGVRTLWLRVPGQVTGLQLQGAIAAQSPGDARAARRYFTGDGEPFVFGTQTYALTNQWGARSFSRVMDILIAKFPAAQLAYSSVMSDGSIGGGQEP